MKVFAIVRNTSVKMAHVEVILKETDMWKGVDVNSIAKLEILTTTV